MIMRPSRRTFLAGAAGAALAWPLARVRGANDDVRVAVLGLHRMGGGHARRFHELPGTRVVSLCDPDRAVLSEHAEAFDDPVKQETDPRAVFDDPDVDAVVIATPNHWHALAAVWACEAGKDVYVEKPVSHDLWEGRQMVAAARKHERIVQTGTQRRSDAALVQAFEDIRGGKLGRIERIHMIFYVSRGGTGRTVIDPPDSVDYDVWSGPAEIAPIRRQNFHHDWHDFWDYGNGELGNNGSHFTDLARIVLGDPPLPPRVWSVGGRFAWDDHGDTPNAHLCWFDYEPAPLITEARQLPAESGANVASDYRGHRMTLMVVGEDGYFAGLNGGAYYDHDGNRVETVDGDGGRDHILNFIEAVRSRRADDLNCDILQGHLSGGLCHMGNVAHRVADHADRDEILASIEHDRGGRDSFQRLAAHLEANSIDIDRHPLRFGPSLAFDPQAERFTGPSQLAERANALCRRAYREPFVLRQQT